MGPRCPRQGRLLPTSSWPFKGSQQPALPSHLVLLLKALGQSQLPGCSQVGLQSSPQTEQSEPLLSLSPGLLPPIQEKGLCPTFQTSSWGRTVGMAVQQGARRWRVSQTPLQGPLSTQGLVFCLIWPPAHLFCALVTYKSPLLRLHLPQTPPGDSLLSCWHSGSCSAGPCALNRP